MKGINLVAFLAFLTVITASKLPVIFEAENECPSVDTCPPKLISHETNCAQYYECKNGQKQLRACAAGLYFSKYWRGCVNQAISDCSPSTGTTPTPPWTWPTQPTPPSGDCIRNGDLIKHECQCDKYYECRSGWKALRECPNGQIFDTESRSCKNGNKITCELDDPNWGECLGNSRRPHDSQCENYYECSNGRWTLRHCDYGWHFDEWALACLPGACNNSPIATKTKKENMNVVATNIM